MPSLSNFKRFALLSALLLTFSNCGGGGSSSSTNSNSDNTQLATTQEDDFNKEEYKGLVFYKQNIPSSSYTLKQLNDTSFNQLTATQKLHVADTLLSTLFFEYPIKKLQSKIDSQTFISNLYNGLQEDKTDKENLEEHILNEDIFQQSNYNEQVAVDILTRFYAMQELDSYFLKNWTAYILTQTIMFSPAYELDSTHTPNIARVYNRIVRMLNVNSGMRYITYVHMMSEDNWRRFRSPEDNGREMLEIFTLDMNDAHVPLAGKALQNWKLDRDNDTLVVSLNENRTPIKLFGTTLYNGDDFFRELVKSNAFTQGVTTRLVNFFFPNKTQSKQTQIIQAIVKSQPETWQDILLQIVFSEEYLLHNNRAKSAEELFFSFAKKSDFKHRKSTFHEFKRALDNMHQATMKYKLGKLKRVPLDTLSFANYHKYIRENLMLRSSNPNKADEYASWSRQGWSHSFLANENFNFNEYDGIESLKSFIDYLFQVTIARHPNSEELNLFTTHMTQNKNDHNSTKVLVSTFNMVTRMDDLEEEQYRREARKENIAILVLDYISRLSETYTIKEVQ